MEFGNVGFFGGGGGGGGGETGVPGELNSRSRDENQLQTQPVIIWRQLRKSNPGHTDGKRVLSPLRHPCYPPLANSNKSGTCRHMSTLLTEMI